MLSSKDFIEQSLKTHLFFGRIMKEHSFFLQIGFTPRNANQIQQANAFRIGFDKFLAEVILLSYGVIDDDVLLSGEVTTKYTLQAERVSTYYTGVNIPTELTIAENQLYSSSKSFMSPFLVNKVEILNERSIALTTALIQFKAILLSNILSCRILTGNYPLLIDHILREARFYLRAIQRLQHRENIDIEKEALEQEQFWNRIMAEHSKFIRGLLDPSEDALIDTANNFAKEFDKLTEEARKAMDKTIPLQQVTSESLKATEDIRNFKTQGTQGLLNCNIESIIIPLLADHTLREANHYLRLLKLYEK